LPVTLQFTIVSVPQSLKMPPQKLAGGLPLALPLLTVKPEMLTTGPLVVPFDMLRTRKSEVPPALLRATMRKAAPGPLMLMLWLMANSALASVIVPVTPKLMLSPFPEAAIVARSEPERRLSRAGLRSGLNVRWFVFTLVLFQTKTPPSS
jgi:hypothetical protein